MPGLNEYGSENPNAGKPANGDRDSWGGHQWPEGVPANLMGVTDFRSKFGEHLSVQIRKELVPLWQLLLAIADAHDYRIPRGLIGGYVNRNVRGTKYASGHSMGLAVDIDWVSNPQSSTFTCDIPVAMVRDFEACGMYWGGRYVAPTKYDPMHFGYCYPPSSVAGHIRKATSILRGSASEQPPVEVDVPLVMSRDSQQREVWATLGPKGIEYISEPKVLKLWQKSGAHVLTLTRDEYNACRAPGTKALV